MTGLITKDEQMRIAESMQKDGQIFDRHMGDFLVTLGSGDTETLKNAWPATWEKHANRIHQKKSNIFKKLEELLNQQKELIEKLGGMHYTEKDAEI